MRLKADYHIHTIYSKNNHGKSTIEEVVRKAVELGLEEIAITDHGPKHFFYGIKKKNIKKAKAEVLEMRKKYPSIKILFGVEANILSYDGDIDMDEELWHLCDIVLCGYHTGAVFSSIKDFFYFYVMNFLARFNKKLKYNMVEKNTDAIVNAVLKNRINILTHPGDKIPVNIERIAEAAVQRDTILEINDHHKHLNAEDIKIAARYDVRFAIDSDSHVVESVGSYQNGLVLAEKSGIDLKRIINLA